MNPLIIDSSAFISLGSVADSNYGEAVKIGKQIEKENRVTILPGEIFTEIVNVAGKKISHQAAIDQANKILSSKSLIITETTSSIRNNALEKFKNQPKSVSFTDCLVMAFADFFETKEIFGFDEVFGKNNYVLPGYKKAGKAA